jgi:hypothetical protein
MFGQWATFALRAPVFALGAALRAHARWLMPQHNGSASSKISVASSVT